MLILDVNFDLSGGEPHTLEIFDLDDYPSVVDRFGDQYQLSKSKRKKLLKIVTENVEMLKKRAAL